MRYEETMEHQLNAPTLPAPTLPAVTLCRQDIIMYEQQLRDMLARLIPFSSHSLFFPQEPLKQEAVWEAEDRRLLIPLVLHGQELGLFVARGVSGGKPVKDMLSGYPALASLCLENLRLHKESISDKDTGLFSKDYLNAQIRHAISSLRHAFTPNIHEQEQHVASCMGLVIVRVASFGELETRYGYNFARSCLAKLADALRDMLWQQHYASCTAARVADQDFAFFLPNASHKSCHQLAEDVIRTLKSVVCKNPVSHTACALHFIAGYANYPQDVQLRLSERSSTEQARLLLKKAHTAVTSLAALATPQSVLGYHRIVHEGACILQRLHQKRVKISIGSDAGAEQGQHFSVWGTAHNAPEGNAEYKGEIVLMEIHAHSAIAEIVPAADSYEEISAGDRLSLHEQYTEQGTTPTQQLFPTANGLLTHHDFLNAWAEERALAPCHALIIMRLSHNDADIPTENTSIDAAAKLCQTFLAIQNSALHTLRNKNADTATNGKPCPNAQMHDAQRRALRLGGQYGASAFLFFHPLKSTAEVQTLCERYKELCELLQTKHNLCAELGIAYYPFLHFRKYDSLDNAVKTLHYASLLPAPHIGVLNSLALNIHADSLMSNNDTFAAISEYKNALLADENNTLAWNSLGVCMASLGKLEEARRYFVEALSRDKNDPATLYNLGQLYQRMDDTKAARAFYRKCLKQKSDHVFSQLRLGQLAEQENALESAEQYYRRIVCNAEEEPTRNATAQDKAPDNAVQALAWRSIARIKIKQNKPQEAREHLHQALILHPQDAFSLQLLAHIYLQNGDDPTLAATLSRQAIALHPSGKAAWLDLAASLRAQGKKSEAQKILAQAEQLQ